MPGIILHEFMDGESDTLKGVTHASIVLISMTPLSAGLGSRYS